MYAFSTFEPLNYFERSSIKRAFSNHIIILVRNLQGRNQSLYLRLSLPLCIYTYTYIFMYYLSKAILLEHLAEIFFILSIFRIFSDSSAIKLIHNERQRSVLQKLTYVLWKLFIIKVFLMFFKNNVFVVHRFVINLYLFV